MNGPQDGYDDTVSALRSHADQLGVSLAIWSARDDGKPDAHARRCANDALEAIDTALRALHQVRQRLTDEIRASGPLRSFQRINNDSLVPGHGWV
jgi:hypothetical protein